MSIGLGAAIVTRQHPGSTHGPPTSAMSLDGGSNIAPGPEREPHSGIAEGQRIRARYPPSETDSLHSADKASEEQGPGSTQAARGVNSPRDGRWSLGPGEACNYPSPPTGRVGGGVVARVNERLWEWSPSWADWRYWHNGTGRVAP